MRIMQNKDDFFFDDCPICRAQKRADDEGRNITMEELDTAFREAEAAGAVTGRPLDGVLREREA